MNNRDVAVIKKLLERIAKELNKGYMCQWCGHKTISPAGGTCQQSPHHHHQYVKAELEEDDIR